MRPVTLLLAMGAVWSGVCAAQGEPPPDAEAMARRIDNWIDARLQAEGVQPLPRADDAEFLRRVYLDLHGVVPAAGRVAAFLDDTSPDKRSALIDELLASPRYGEHLGNLWRRRLVSSLANEQRMQSERFAAWLAERFQRNDGWDRIAAELLTAQGVLDENPAVTYLIEGRFPLSVTDLTDLTSRYFLGIRLNCAQCHDHPFASWTQRDYWGLAAFFAQIQTPGRPKAAYTLGIRDDPRMTLAALADTDMIEGFRQSRPTFPRGEELSSAAQPLYRRALADWMTAPDNPWFARAAVNRMWWQFFGRGLVNPVDDMHDANLASHPELLDELSRQFAASGFDLKWLCRSILLSRAYQRTSRAGPEPQREAALFARMSVKVLTAEQLYDSLVQVLGPPVRAASINLRLGARYEFTQFFADDGDADPTRYDRGIPQLLRLMNSPQFAGRSLDALAADAAAGRSTDEAVEAMFLTILARRPTPQERDELRAPMGAGASPRSALRELAWALLMSSEFSLNH